MDFLSLSRARAKKKKKTKRRTEEAPVAHLPTDASSSSSSFYRPTDRKERRKKENARCLVDRKKRSSSSSLEGYVVLARKSCRIQKEYQKGLHRIVSSLFFPPSTKKKTTRVIYSPRTSLFFSRTPEKTKKTKTCRSLSLSLSFRLSKHFRQKRRSFKPFVVDRKSLCRRPTKKTKKARDIFFKKKTYKTLNATASFFCC